MQLPIFNMSGRRWETNDLVRNQQMLNSFGGYDRRPGAPEGTFCDETNMGTWGYPTLSTRRHRMTVTDDNSNTIVSTAGICDADTIISVVGSQVRVNTTLYEMNLSTAAEDCPKQLVRMGAYLLIWPDMKYINTKKPSDRGSIENTFEKPDSGAPAMKVMVDENGQVLGSVWKAKTAPDSPADGAWWLDTSQKPPVMNRYNAAISDWEEDVPVYITITYAGIGDGFVKGDYVVIDSEDDKSVNGTRMLTDVGEGYIIFQQPIKKKSDVFTIMLTISGAMTVKRAVPDMDFITECDNRIWGCKYGLVDGKPVNEIYACKLGDFKSWYTYEGLATDSYAASRGSDGPFTGAVTYQGHPLFFKEKYLEKVYPSSTGAHQIVTQECRGVQEGCWRSLAIENETLFYKNRHCVCAYTGSVPVNISEALGHDYYQDARAGAANGMYYICMQNSKDSDLSWHFFTYDIAKGVWSREDDTVAMMFIKRLGRIYYVDESDKDENDRPKVKRYYSQGENVATTAINWSVTSNVIGLDLAENEYISRFVIRCETLGHVHLEIRYDEETETVDGVTQEKWIDKGTVQMNGLGSFVLAVAPKRCDHLRIRLSGDRQIKIYSVAKYIEGGSDVYLSPVPTYL